MMQHYIETKKEYDDCILFYRLGDFYEMFFEDAVLVSKTLELTLTGKACGLEERAPMCGIPFHAADGYINRLVSEGFKVAICEQVEDPKLAKGIVKREVIRVVTPGTNVSPESLDESTNSYIMSIVHLQNKIGISFADISTGDFFVTEVEDNKKLLDEINKIMPKEIICNDAFLVSSVDTEDIRNRLKICINALGPWYFEEDNCKNILLKHFRCLDITALGIEDFASGIIASGALLTYLYETQKVSLSQLTHISPYICSKYMLLDSSTRRNLELTYTLREKQKRGTLLWVLDKTKTAMGARTLRGYIEQPLIDQEEIIKRQDFVKELLNNSVDRDEVREYLSAIYDLERLLTKVSYKSANPRDLVALKNSLKMLPHIKNIISNFECQLVKELNENLDPLEDIADLIDQAIIEDPPLSSKEGGFIREGYDENIDKLKVAKTDGKNWLLELETTERERTGIKGLKVKYNKVFGYYFEVTNSYKDLVPEDYIRKQTLTGAERFTTPKLKELEDMILNAQDKLFALEYDAFCTVRDHIEASLVRIQKSAKSIAAIDAFASLAVVAERNRFVCPHINTKGVIDIKGGRHPVVEKMLSNGMFIDNDTYLDNKKDSINVITGPNMAGKS
ncbi:MAG TPA: DNA mismatch repair protein MutS, partial [Lachnospiraceae bacterium]|nr:DNA mismatch repair protein MutS [Lachnospiraceae bacterium]